MPRSVIKLGGSVLRSPDDLNQIIPAIKRHTEPPVIVVSAMYGVTDLLIDAIGSRVSCTALLAELRRRTFAFLEYNSTGSPELTDARQTIDQRLKLLGEFIGRNHQESSTGMWRDLIVSWGERLASAVVVYQLNQHGLTTNEIFPEELGLTANEPEVQPAINVDASRTRVARLLTKPGIWVVPGFYAVGESGQVRLLGRNGSDCAAAALASCIDASKLELWKDVNGIYSGDPDVVDSSKPISHLTYSEAESISMFGASVLHASTIGYIKAQNIPLQLRSVNSDGSGADGTSVSERPSGQAGPRVVTSTCGLNIVSINLTAPGSAMNTVTRAISQVLLTTETFRLWTVSSTRLQVLISENLTSILLEELEELGKTLPMGVEMKQDQCLIAIIGHSGSGWSDLGQQILEALKATGINAHQSVFGTFHTASYLTVDTDDHNQAIRAIHATLFEAANEAHSNQKVSMKT